ncbi:uncharacterized protein CIMG_12739 [Coccidioides immitis RS]|uniref:uncharacterized protein n=1 Tax=Coccidioides immitis (strain RS) TaxID=246410 RepID=UPI00027D286E|nr:uncharacterized protein CIMG_12739 [Coccidioides immitis RS]EAS36611.3 hypothetical protein CIMG_12739 [Coccidioides immitis RS]
MMAEPGANIPQIEQSYRRGTILPSHRRTFSAQGPLLPMSLVKVKQASLEAPRVIRHDHKIFIGRDHGQLEDFPKVEKALSMTASHRSFPQATVGIRKVGGMHNVCKNDDFRKGLDDDLNALMPISSRIQGRS